MLKIMKVHTYIVKTYNSILEEGHGEYENQTRIYIPN